MSFTSYQPDQGLEWGDENWNDEYIEQYIQADLYLIRASLSHALSQIANRLQFVWNIEKSGRTIVVKVQEEQAGDLQGEAVQQVEQVVGVQRDIEDDDCVVLSDDDDEGTETLSVSSHLSGLHVPVGGPSNNVRAVSKKNKNSGPLGSSKNKHAGPSVTQVNDVVPSKPKEKTPKGDQLKDEKIASIIQALEQDLATDFADEKFKKCVLYGRLSCFSRSHAMIVAALYLLPHWASTVAIKKLIFGTMMDKSQGSNSRFNTHLKMLVQFGALNNQGGIAGKYSMNTKFLMNMLGDNVSFHDEVRLEKFVAMYSRQKLLSSVAGNKRKKPSSTPQQKK